MKNRKLFSALALLLVIALVFSGCGANLPASESEAYDMAYSESQEMPMSVVEESYDSDMMELNFTSGVDNTEQQENAQTVPQNPAEKIIYSGYACVETLEFEKSIEDLMKMLSDCGGFIQYSDITGSDFNSLHSGAKTYRRANYTLRIPAESFNGFNEGLSAIGNVPYSSTNAENITMQYNDTSSKLAARQTEETRLLELLAKAETVEDIITIEQRLSEIRYEIESLTSQIKNWDNKVSYSTLELELREVTLYSEDSPATLSYGEQLKEAFIRSLKGIGRFFKNLLKFLVAALPVMVVLAVAAVVVVLIVKAVRKRRQVKVNDKHDE